MVDRGRIKLFLFIQQTYQDIGVHASESDESGSDINPNRRRFVVGLGQMFITSAAYLLVEANSMFEYGRAFYTFITVLLSMILYSIMIWQMEKILNYIENCELFIEKSEYSQYLNT